MEETPSPLFDEDHSKTSRSSRKKIANTEEGRSSNASDQVLQSDISFSRSHDYGAIAKTEVESTVLATTKEKTDPPTLSRPPSDCEKPLKSSERLHWMNAPLEKSDCSGDAVTPLSVFGTMPAIESQKNDGNSEVGRDECRSFLRSDLSKLSTTSRSLVDDKDKTTRISLKILLSKNVAGSIIGKSGDAIARAQRNSLCRIKLSQSCSFFPGTTDRVCLLQGEQKQHVNDAVHAVLEKMREVKKFSTTERSSTQRAEQNEFIVRILLPTLASGLLIGRGGSTIKTISDKTNVKIHLASKNDAVTVSTRERIVSITGNMGSCKACVFKIIDVMANNPDVCQYSNLTTFYRSQDDLSDLGELGSLPSQITQPKAMQCWAEGISSPLENMALHGCPSSASVRESDIHPGTGGQGLNAHLAPHTVLNVPTMSSTRTLVQRGHRQIGEDFYLISATPGSSISRSPTRIHPSIEISSFPAEHSNFPIPPSGAFQAYGTVLARQRFLGPLVRDGNADSIQMNIPNSLIGVILGRGGTLLHELQSISGARIEISQRGQYVAGTTNRIVTISGTAQSCATAHFLITRKLTEHRR